MNAEQIERYEYCKKYLDTMAKWTLPFSWQMYGCGSQSPNIEHELQKIHGDMYNKIAAAIGETKNKIQEKIDKI